MALSIQQSINRIIASVPGSPIPETVDTVKTGDTSQTLKGVAVTFLATCEVIDHAARLGANLIITHEPTFYSHLDSTEWLQSHPVFKAKRDLIERHQLVIWRFHDYLHTLTPDSTVAGLIEAMNWEAYISPSQPNLCSIPPLSFQALGDLVKTRLGLSQIRTVGNLAMECRTIAVLPGFPPAEIQMTVLGLPEVDVLITGEIHEWETCEYARDANSMGIPKGLIVLGHGTSEEIGVKRLVPWIQNCLPEVPVQFLQTEPAIETL